MPPPLPLPPLVQMYKFTKMQYLEANLLRFIFKRKGKRIVSLFRSLWLSSSQTDACSSVNFLPKSEKDRDVSECVCVCV